MFIARQSIVNRNIEVYGYELLIRTQVMQNSYGQVDETIATATVISESLIS